MDTSARPVRTRHPHRRSIDGSLSTNPAKASFGGTRFHAEAVNRGDDIGLVDPTTGHTGFGKSSHTGPFEADPDENDHPQWGSPTQ